MKIHAATTLGYSAYGIETALAQLADTGLREVEISHMGSFCVHLPYPDTTAEAVADALDRNAVRAMACNISLGRWEPEGRDRFFDYTDSGDAREAVARGRWYLELASRLGVRTVTMSTARRQLDEREWLRHLKAAAGAFREQARIASDLGMYLHLEVPHLFQITDSVEHVKAMFEEIDHPAVAATVDTSHWGVIGYDPDDLFAFLGDCLRHVHLRDASGSDTRDFRQDLELTPGRGTVDFAAFREALQRAGYQRSVSLDFEYRMPDIPHIRGEFDYGLAALAEAGWRTDG